MHPWELHPIFTHFPIAFLVGGIVLDLVAMQRPRESLTRPAAGLLLAGVVTGWVTALAGILAFYYAPHTEEGHRTMLWHAGFAAPAMILFTIVAILRWRDRPLPVRSSVATTGLVALALLTVAGFLGGTLVYREGTGVTASGVPAPDAHEHVSAESPSDH